MLGFRVWDSEYKRFGCVDFMKINQQGELAATDNQGYEYNIDKTYIPMQSTGLKDCNYVEIFEGDIFRWEGGCIYTVKDIIKFIQDTTSWDGIENRVFTVVSVIGNIYENPDLIKQEK